MVTQKNNFTTALLIADIKGLSVLVNDEQLSLFVEKFYPRLNAVIDGHGPLAATTWCDSLFCAFAAPLAAAEVLVDVGRQTDVH